MRHRFLLLNDFQAGGMLSQWNLSSPDSQSLPRPSFLLIDRWTKELQCLITNFHLEGLVHGDLRDANILCKEEYVMLLDFDWGGKDGEVFYPTENLNNELQEGRVSDDLRITKEDDRRVLGKTLAKLYV